MTVGDIKKVVAEKMGVSLKQLNSRCRLRKIALARQMAIFYTYCQGFTQVEVGRKFKCDHSSVSHSVRRIKDSREVDPEVRAMLEGIEDEYPVLRGQRC
jgi:chromosomal replication initiation ATPase DnaA